MVEGTKKKREIDEPRITYHAENRTFDRLFKEESLGDTHNVVRRKLGLPADAVIHLAQLREGKTIDLEDEDDFEAFRAVAYSTSAVDVRVTVGASQSVSQSSDQTRITDKSIQDASVPAAARDLAAAISLSQSIPAVGKGKRKVSFAEAANNLDTSVSKERKKKKQRRVSSPSENDTQVAKPTSSNASIDMAAEGSGTPETDNSSLRTGTVESTDLVSTPTSFSRNLLHSAAVLKKSKVTPFTSDRRELTTSLPASSLQSSMARTDQLKYKKAKPTLSSDVTPSIEASLSEQLPPSASVANSRPVKKSSKSKKPSPKPSELLESNDSSSDSPIQNAAAVQQKHAKDISDNSKTSKTKKMEASQSEPSVPKKRRKSDAVDPVSSSSTKPSAQKKSKKTASPAVVANSEPDRVHGENSVSEVFSEKAALQTDLDMALKAVFAAKDKPHPQDATSWSPDETLPVPSVTQQANGKPKTRKLKPASARLQSPRSTNIPAASQNPLRGKQNIASLKDLRMPEPDSDIHTGTDTDSSDSDDSESESGQSNEVTHSHTDIAISSNTRPTSYTDVDLDALIRGPLSKRTVADILSTDLVDEEDGIANDVVLEEDNYEDDRKLRRMSKTFQGVGFSDDENDQDDPDDLEANSVSPLEHPPFIVEASPPNVVTSNSPSPNSLTLPASSDPVSFEVVNSLGESIELDKSGDVAFSDALAADTAIFKLAGDDSEDVTIIAASAEKDDISVSLTGLDDSEEDIPLSLKNTTETDSCAGKTHHQAAKVANATPVSGNGSKPPSDYVNALPPYATATDIPSRHTDDEDPVEPAEDFLRPPSDVASIESHQPLDRTQSNPSHLTPASMVKRMKNRNGQVPGNDAFPVLATERDVAPAPTPRRRSQRSQSSALHDSASMPPPPAILVPLKRRQQLKSEAGKANKTAAKLPAKEEKAVQRQRKSSTKSALERTTKRASAKFTDSPVPQESVNPASEEPHVKPPSRRLSLDRWSTLPHSSPHFDPDSSVMVDQLRSSSPESQGPPLSPQVDEDLAETTLKENPLFLLSGSQVPFPYSQWDSVSQSGDQAAEQKKDDPSDTEDDSDSNAEVILKQPTQAKTRTNNGPFRRLTDLATQPLFSSPPVLRPATFLSKSTSKNKLDDLYGRNGDEDDADEEDASDADESHIPKARRAGLRSI